MNFLGGWLRIGRVITDKENIRSYSGYSVLSANLSTLHKAASQNFLLDGNKFFDLEFLIGFTEYRIFCTKPYHGRTHHAKFSKTSSVSMFNYTIGESHYRPSDLCLSLIHI